MPPDAQPDVMTATTPLGQLAKTILVAEDSASFRLMLKHFLTGEGFNVLEAADGDEAWDRVSSCPFMHLVVTDINMPGSSGTELLGKIREHYPDLPVILITGSPSIDAAVQCIRSGAFDYIAKPFALDAFRKQVDAALATATTGGMRAARGFAGFRIVRTLGEGASGIVFLVERADANEDSPPQYALKILKGATEDSPARVQVLDRFVHEVEAAYQVKHPNVVEYIEHGLGRDEKIPYLVMEYFPGVTLSAFASMFPNLTLAEKAGILQQIAAALGAIHAHGILHRDVKPANLLIDPQTRRLKLTDFGVARLPNSDLTVDNQVVGTPAYMAPEACISARFDYRADIFSLGVVAYEFLLGQRLWPEASNLATLVQTIQTYRPPAPRSIMPDFPPALENVLEHALQKDPLARLSSTVDLATVFGQCADGRLPAPATGLLPALGRLFHHRGPRVWA